MKSVLLRRFFAHGIDFGILFPLNYGITLMIARGFDLNPFQEQMADAVISTLLTYPYYVELQYRTGWTLGKRILGIRVCSMDSRNPVTRLHYQKRYFGYLLSYLTMGCGFLMAFFNSSGRMLHDLFSGTATRLIQAD